MDSAMRAMEPVEAFDTLYKLAIDGGSEPALFGRCALEPSERGGCGG